MASTKNMTPIQSFAQVPPFADEDEEAAFWATHELGEEILASMGPLPEAMLPTRPRTKPVTVRFDEDTVERIKALAARRHKGYQTMLKEFVMERLHEEEKREGLIGRPE
jgi:hypothetical protein